MYKEYLGYRVLKKKPILTELSKIISKALNLGV